MKDAPSGIPVMVYTSSGENCRGMLVYSESGPKVMFDDNQLSNNGELTSFSFTDLSVEPHNQLKIMSDTKFKFSPDAVIRLGYSKNIETIDTLYPPSTDGWVSHVTPDDSNSVYTIQQLEESNNFLLTIVDIQANTILDAHILKPYELGILMMKSDWIVHKEILKLIPFTEESIISDLLDNTEPSWELISELVDSVTIPNLKLKGNMRETMDQLVPLSFPESVREDVMAFLIWTFKKEIPNEDPVDFLNRYGQAWVFRSLVSGHIQCLLDGIEPPSYVRIMMLADRKSLTMVERPRAEDDEQDPWYNAYHRISEEFPDFTGKMVGFASQLTEHQEIVTKQPVTRSEALKSKKAWRDRFALISQGIIMRGLVHRELLGLKTLVYTGAAHRWPHKHLDWSARLSFQMAKQPHIQVMVLPPRAVEQVTRAIKTARVVDWTWNSFNLSLYNLKTHKWTMNSSLIIKSLERSRSLRQLENEFLKLDVRHPFSITPVQAKVLDMISWGLYLTSLEDGSYFKYYEIDERTFSETLHNLKEKGIFSLHYFPLPDKLSSVCVLASGPPKHICSLSRAFLKHTPSSHVRITENGSSCSIVSRIPEDKTYDLLRRLPSAASQSQVSVRIAPISAYVGYRHNLHQRLLKEDASWDYDVSGLLDQIRLPSKGE